MVEEVKDCIFQPKISKSTEKILMNSQRFDEEMTTFDKNMMWKRTVEKNIQNKHLIQERRLLQECFFEPQIGKTTTIRPEDIKNRRRNDNMFNKSQEWKLKIETRKRQKEIEIEKE